MFEVVSTARHFPTARPWSSSGGDAVGALPLGAGALPSWVLPGCATLATLVGSSFAVFSDHGFGGTWIDLQVIYLWVVLASAYLLTRTQLTFQLVLVAVSYAVVLGLTVPLEEAAPRWLAGLATVVAAALLVGALRARIADVVYRLSDAARTDPLTGLQNRRGFEESFGAEIERARREGTGLTVLLADLDNFKALNDDLGHPAGDAALVRVSQLLLSGLRRPDPVARTGGEEFALLLPGASGATAWAISERMRGLVEKAFRADSVPVTISLGLASYPDDGDTADALLAAADQALYAAKRLGRNRSVIFSEEIAPLVSGRGESADVQLATLLGLAEALDLRDSGTADHCRTVARYCAAIAAELGLPAERVKRIETAGILHDVGKIGLPDAILRKPGKLTDEEWRPLRRHPEIGARILSDDNFADIREWILAHHERMDGKGYPRGLSPDRIPLEARIIAVADSYEAMTADRVYREALSEDAARSELLRCAGTQFDPVVVAAFMRSMREEERLVPAEVAHGQEDPGHGPAAGNGNGNGQVHLRPDDAGSQPVHHVLEGQRLGEPLQNGGQVVGRVEDAGDEDQRQEDGVGVGGRGVEIGYRVGERDAEGREAGHPERREADQQSGVVRPLHVVDEVSDHDDERDLNEGVAHG
jgi:diguanylate cyclase (GGDEF)-like protein